MPNPETTYHAIRFYGALGGIFQPMPERASHFNGYAITTASICGQRPIATPGTITYGRSSWPGQFPWHVALYRTEQQLSISYACGGFIVGERVVITAAHCVTAPSGYQLASDELTVRVGLYDLLTFARHSQEHRVGRIHRHANFTVGSPRHDLALLTLRTVVEFGDFVRPICLPHSENAPLGVEVGIVSGWGLTESDIPSRTLRSATLPVVNFTRCLESDSALFGPILYEGMFCAGWENGKQDDPEAERKHQSNLALIELERTVPLSTCQLVCLWTEQTLPAGIFLYSAVNVSAGDKSIESPEVTVQIPESRCYDELLAPMVMMQQKAAYGGQFNRLVGIVLERTCTKTRFIRVEPFLEWIEGIVWKEAASSDHHIQHQTAFEQLYNLG
uniref:Peptidase S1 domain-containing protein n=1 Tax=Anopheles epiroticus TaxID=199890 RepID=A0A182P0D3_9DIPT